MLMKLAVFLRMGGTGRRGSELEDLLSNLGWYSGGLQSGKEGVNGVGETTRDDCCSQTGLYGGGRSISNCCNTHAKHQTHNKEVVQQRLVKSSSSALLAVVQWLLFLDILIPFPF